MVVGTHQPGGDRDVLDPQILELELDRSAVYAGVRHGTARTDEFGAHVECQRDPDRLNRYVHAQAVGHRHHFFFPRGAAAVDSVGGTEAACLVEPVVVEVDGDDARGAVEASRHHRGEPDRAGADDGDNVAGLDPPVAHTDLEAGRQDVGQHHRRLVADTGGELVKEPSPNGTRTYSA